MHSPLVHRARRLLATHARALALVLTACSRTTPAPPVSIARDAARATPYGDNAPVGRFGQDPALMIQRLDRNGNGTLELAELPPRMQARLAAADTDHDGVITAEELRAMRRARRAQHFTLLDTDHDGVVSAAEAGPRWEALRSADTDQDGRVTLAEFEASPAMAVVGGDHGLGAGAAPPDGSVNFAGLVRRYDRNGDGLLQVSELPDDAQGPLGAADTDHDGVLSAAEIALARARDLPLP